MTQEQLEEKIKNGETIYYFNTTLIKPQVYEEKLTNKHNIKFGRLCKDWELICDRLDRIFSTKAEAEHHLNDAGIQRIDELPFVTWEEFLEHPYILFKNYSDFYSGQNGIGKLYSLTILDNKLLLKDECEIDLEEWELSEENFYAAYKLMKKLFLGE